MLRRAVVLTAALAGLPVCAGAQQSSSVLESVVVTAEPVRAESVAQPFSAIDALELERHRATTVGEMLRGLPGVSATGFGSNASRPIIRGQEGDRVRILQNSAPAQDVSGMSDDHAMGINPFAIERAEFLRGPSALLYGGSAVGGVVNLVDRRIARTRIEEGSRALDLRFDSANQNRQMALELESSPGQDMALHLDGFMQRNGDTRTPRFTDNGTPAVTGSRVRNTAADSSGLGFGLTRFSGGSYWGISAENFQSSYGVPKEVNTRIDLNRNRFALAGDQQLGSGWFELMRIRAGATDYQHTEIESGSAISKFKNEGQDLRIELVQRSATGWRGVFGAQFENSRLDVSAVSGETPLLPNTRSPNTALFALQERKLGEALLKVGARIESASVSADSTFSVTDYGAKGVDGAVSTSGAAAKKSFVPLSVSAELGYPLTSTTRAAVSVSHVERAPSRNELFATGVHHANGLFEIGSSNLNVERGAHADVTISHQSDGRMLRASAFASRYTNYITLMRRSGSDFYHEGQAMPVYDYSGIDARFHGAELEYRQRFISGAWQIKPGLVMDQVVGRHASTNANIARLTPQRITPSIDFAHDRWLIRPELQFVSRAKLGENETFQAPGYTLFNFLIEQRRGSTVVFLRGFNLTNRLAYQATTVDEVRQFAPLAGRSVQAGARILF